MDIRPNPSSNRSRAETPSAHSAGGVGTVFSRSVKAVPAIYRFVLASLWDASGKVRNLSIKKRQLKIVSPGTHLKTKGSSESLPQPVKKALKVLGKSSTKAEVKQVLTKYVKTPEQLGALAKSLPDESFRAMKGSIMDHLQTLEARFHVGIMLTDLQNKSGKPGRKLVVRTLCQHREFIAQSTANPYFTDGVDYVKSRLTAFGEAQVQILKQAFGCSDHDLKLSSLEIMNSGVGATLKVAEKKGGEQLKQARDQAAVKMEHYLEKHAPGKAGRVKQLARFSKEISLMMAEILRSKLKASDHDELRNGLAEMRTTTSMEDLTRKAETLGVLTDRLNMLQATRLDPNGTAINNMKALLGEKIVRADAELLGQVVAGNSSPPEHMIERAEKEILAVAAKQLAEQMTGVVSGMAEKAENPDSSQVDQAMQFVELLHGYRAELKKDLMTP